MNKTKGCLIANFATVPVCGCVSEKAPNSVTAVELAAAALDVNARATIVNQVVSKTVNACVAEALQK
ncbi:hypothetical protein [Acinetobacter baumannii]|uniref:hypothetical protein n=1 Tax=Acinetobacter baumannii TaxID=470 RepID=UPI0004644B4E|nr:hypothetical protein [Acinetobacter baumannii]ELB0054850.1 hypothetical protein [Acinetobacter baumannii]